MTLKPHLDLPTAEYLREVLQYDPETGHLHWRERSAHLFKSRYRSAQANADSWNTRFAGKQALITPDGYGYLCGSIDDVKYQAHRVIWKMVFGTEPEFIDHEDGFRSNNRLLNLRDVSHEQNQKNQKRFITNTSGATGVYWSPRKGRWEVRVRINGRQTRFGSYESFDEAAALRRDIALQNGFHPNHGQARQ